MASTDLIQRINEAVVAVLDTLPSIVAITGKPNGNVIPWESVEDVDRPTIAYLVPTAAEIGGTGDTRRVTVQFTAFADDGRTDVVNALIEQVEMRFGFPAFAALPIPLDAYVEARTRQYVGDSDTRADLDVTLIVTK